MKKRNTISNIYTTIVFIFLYLPIFVLIVMSFNTSKDTISFQGFTLDWYAELFRPGSDLLRLMLNTLIIAVLSAVISTVLGTMAAVGICSMKRKMRDIVMSITNIPMTNPDIVTGVSLALLFSFIGSILKIQNILGFATLLMAHITFNLPYVILSVMPKLRQMDPHLTEAALDLGCTPVRAFFKVTLPQIMPGVLSGMIMAFTLSLDDFVISYFVTGPSFITLPVEIYNYTKKPMQPTVYALFTVMFVAILILMIVMNVVQARDEKKQKKDRLLRRKKL